MFFSEISGSLYAWDLADEGIERILDNLQEMTGCNSVYLVAIMHHEKRPLTDFFYPHNPVRKVYYPEDSRAYFRPDMKSYGRIKPLVTERDFLRSTDWLQTLIDAARKRNLRTGAELSHTVIDLERSRTEFLDCQQRNIYGNPLEWYFCPNNPDVREYVGNLCVDLTRNYDVDYIQTCLLPFHAGHGFAQSAARILGVAMGGCFCSRCEKVAKDAGLDLRHIETALKPLADSIAYPSLEQAHEMALLAASNTGPVEMLLETPELWDWLKLRRTSLESFYREVHARMHESRPGIDLRFNHCWTWNPELDGICLRTLKAHLDSIRVCDYTEQSGDMNAMEQKRQWLLAVRREVGSEMYVLSALGVRPKANPELIRRGVVIAAQCGMDGLTMGHYDGAPFSHLQAVKEGMIEADVEMLPL